jgi:D-methionine transport system substrate-binding protein
MKKKLFCLLIAGALVFVFNQTVEAKGNAQKPGSVLSVGASPVPHAELLNLIKDDLAAKGITLKVIEFTDYVQPNEALLAGDIDANFFQHIPYLESNEEWSSRLIAAFGVHIEPFGVYSKKYRSIDELPIGASIAIPNDPSNGGRALLLLQAEGFITLKEGIALTATIYDITSNPKNFKFQELEAAQLPRSLQDVDAAAINGNYALQAGFHPLKDSLIIEGPASPYVNIVVVQRGNEQDPRILALKETLLSRKVWNYIADTWTDGSVVPVF